MRRVMILLTGAIILSLSGCTSEQIPTDCPTGTPDMSFSGDIQPIFNNNCVSCHSGSTSPDLSPGISFTELTEGGYVDNPQEEPCETALYQVLTDTHIDRASEEEVFKILGWIQDGAEDN
jgi:hypothetical protein